jgi:hypothetical protein
MRKWGIVISLFYAVVVAGLVIPSGIILSGSKDPLGKVFSEDLADLFSVWLSWVLVAAVIAGQALLLFLSVDTSQKRLRPRSHIAVSVIVSSMLVALLVLAGLSALGAAAYHDQFFDKFWTSARQVFSIWVALWAVWALVFYLWFRNSAASIGRVVSWLLRGSVLELLVSVPCHVWVRRRGDCSAPLATSFGIVTGIAVMLLCFGPSVLFLVKKRLNVYSAHKPA